MKIFNVIIMAVVALAAFCIACSDDDSNAASANATSMTFQIMSGTLNASVTLTKGFEGVYTNTVDETNEVAATYTGEAAGSCFDYSGVSAPSRGSLNAETALIAGASSFLPLTKWTQDYLLFSYIPLADVGTTTVKGVEYRLSAAILKATGTVFSAACYDSYGRSAKVTFTEYGPVGGMIRGTFSFVIQTNSTATAGMLPIVITNGKFAVKRVADNCPQFPMK